jgi:hypothetical protein
LEPFCSFFSLSTSRAGYESPSRRTYGVELTSSGQKMEQARRRRVAVRVQLREKPGGVAVGGEEFDDGFEDSAGSARSRTQFIDARSARIEAAPAVAAALRWRGRCDSKSSALRQSHRQRTANARPLNAYPIAVTQRSVRLARNHRRWRARRSDQSGPHEVCYGDSPLCATCNPAKRLSQVPNAYRPMSLRRDGRARNQSSTRGQVVQHVMQ